MATDLIGQTLPTSPACHACGKRLDHEGGLYVEPEGGDGDNVRAVCEGHASGSSSAVIVERRSRPENEQEWDEWLAITAVTE